MLDTPSAATVVTEAPPAVRLRALVQEMRMPITPVKLQVEVLLGGALGPEQRRSLELIERNCTRFVNLLEELEREVARLEAS